jgi:SWI/SNF-related matrix-associated actin-dependent regulator 1 of chromatin subfamily A
VAPIEPLLPSVADASALYEYQTQGARWLASKRHALLADEPGLGKSAQAVTAADIINADRILVICPASVRVNWIREFEKFSMLGGDSTALLTGQTTGIMPASRFVTCSYDLTTRSDVLSSLRNWLRSASRGVLIPDEVHFCKSTDAQRSQAVLGKDGLAHVAKRIYCLSGTPAPNHLAETFPLLRTFGVWRDSYDAFVGQFCTTRESPYGTVICGNKNIGQFRELIRPIILRRKYEEVMAELPELRYGDVVVPAGPVDLDVQFPEYYFITNREKDLLDSLGKQRAAVELIADLKGTGGEGLDAINALLDADNRGGGAQLRRYVGLQKLQPTIDLVTDELNSGLDKIVLFAHHRAIIEGLRDGLSKFGAVTLYGGMNAFTKQKNVDKFARDPRCRVFAGNIKAAGVAIDGLQRQCCNVMFVETVSVPGDMAQAIMRVRRNGQTRPVLVRSVRLADDPLFEKIERARFRKARDLVAAFD